MSKAPLAAGPNEGPGAAGPGKTSAAAPDAAVRSAVLAALGSPPELLRVVVAPLWKGCFRVNVLTGADAATVRIAHSFFIEASERGDITSATPKIVRQYP